MICENQILQGFCRIYEFLQLGFTFFYQLVMLNDLCYWSYIYIYMSVSSAEDRDNETIKMMKLLSSFSLMN